MKNIRLAGWMGLLCVFLLTGCGNKSGDTSISGSDSSGDVSQFQEMTTEQLHQYFQEAFDTKGNALDTPEQLALEVAEIEALAADAALPDNYEEQYEEWRTDHIEALLETLQGEYDQIVAGLSLFDGVNSGAAYADCIDFDQNGIPELLLVSLSAEIDGGEIYGWSGSLELYGESSGHAQTIGTGNIGLPPFYHSDYDPKKISLVQREGRTFIHTLDTEGRDIFDCYYSVENGMVKVADETYSGELNISSSGQDVTYEVYESIHNQYTDEVVILADTSSASPVHTRGILPELSSSSKQRLSFLDILSHDNIKYAKLLDFDQDGNEDLIVVEKSADRYIYCVYAWNGTEVERTPFENMYFGLDIEGGIYRKKSDGALYLYCNDFTDGAYDTTYQFSNLTDSDIISTEDYEHIQEEYVEGWHFSDEDAVAFSARLGQYEMIEEFCLYYSAYNDYMFTISEAFQKLTER